MFIYKYDQLKDRIKYNDIHDRECRKLTKGLHLGQLKLLISEIMFLTKTASDGNKVVYVGAAGGYHIPKLLELFPNLTYDLWDPGRFYDEVKNADKSKVTIFNKFFTNDDAKKYTSMGSNILFISDIRNLDIADYTKHAKQKTMDVNDIDMGQDNIVLDDNIKQNAWVKIINPKYAFLKYRLPYQKGKTQSLTGKIYLQCYAPVSTEARLLTNNYETMIDMDNEEYDEKMAYFNCYIRVDNENLTKWAKVMEKNNIKNNWDNNYAFYVLHCYLDKIKGINDENKVVELFNDIIDYHKQKFGKKYDILYVK